jgi:hypothetical protein
MKKSVMDRLRERFGNTSLACSKVNEAFAINDVRTSEQGMEVLARDFMADMCLATFRSFLRDAVASGRSKSESPINMLAKIKKGRPRKSGQ